MKTVTTVNLYGLQRVPEIELAAPLRDIIKCGALRYLRMRHPNMTLSDLASGAGLPIVRIGEIERCKGDALTDAELLKLHRVFAKNGLTR